MPKKVLIADDEPNIVMSLQFLMEYEGYEVRTVADGGESFYFCGDHRATFPALRRAVIELS